LIKSKKYLKLTSSIFTKWWCHVVAVLCRSIYSRSCIATSI